MSDESNDTQQLTPVRERAALEAQSAGILPIIPTNIEEAQRYANGLIAAGQVPDAYKFRKNVLATPEEVEAGAPPVKHREGTINGPLVLMGVLKSMELGVAPQTGLAGLLPLNGRFSPYGDLFVGLMQRAGKITNHKAVRIGPSFDPDTPLGEWPPEYGWSFTVWRLGQEEPYVGVFTVRDAKRASLWLNKYKQPWIEYPDRMLFNRARAFALRDGFADALIGFDLHGIAEEVLDTLPVVEDGPKLIERRRALLTDDEPDTGELENATPQDDTADAAAATPAATDAETGGPDVSDDAEGQAQTDASVVESSPVNSIGDGDGDVQAQVGRSTLFEGEEGAE